MFLKINVSSLEKEVQKWGMMARGGGYVKGKWVVRAEDTCKAEVEEDRGTGVLVGQLWDRGCRGNVGALGRSLGWEVDKRVRQDISGDMLEMI